MATLSGFGTSGSLTNFIYLGNGGTNLMGKILSLHSRGTPSAPHSTPVKSGDTVGYQVPSGKNFLIIGAFVNQTAASNSEFSIAYGDSDVGMASSSAPTNAVSHYQFGIASTEFSKYVTLGTRIPAGKYLYTIMGSSGNNAFHIFGIEIDADATTI